MARKREIKTSGGGFGAKRTLITFGLVFLILYVGGHIISRTDGVRSTVADKISNGTRLPVSLERCGATPLMGLRLEGLVIHDLEMPDAELSLNWFSFLSRETPFVKELRLKEPVIRFRREPKTGSWEPLVMHGIGQRLGAVVGLNPTQTVADETLPVFPPYAINKNTLLKLENAEVTWCDEQGNVLASINGTDFNIKVGRFIDREVRQIIVECNRIKLASGQALEDFRLEAFRVADSDWTTVLEMSDSQGEYPEFATPTLWQDLSLHLSRLSAVQ